MTLLPGPRASVLPTVPGPAPAVAARDVSGPPSGAVPSPSSPSSPPSPPPRAVALVTDDADVRAAVLAAAGDQGVAVDPWPRSLAGRAWAVSPALVLGEDAVADARGLAGASRGPSRVLVASAAGRAAASSPPWLPGATHVALPGSEGDLSDWLGAAGPQGRGPGVGTAVGVVGGRGGAGASTAAVALARAAARAAGAAALVDADPSGGGLDLALGLEGAAGPRWDGLARAGPGALGPEWLVAALPRAAGVWVVSHARPVPEAATTVPGGWEGRAGARLVGEVLDALLPAFPLTVLDLPRYPSPAVDAALLRCAVLVVVVPAEVRACASAAAVVAGLAAGVPDVRLLVRGPAPAGLPAEEVAEAVGVPVFREVRPEPGLAVALEHGEDVGVGPRSPLRRWADALVASLPVAATAGTVR